MKIRPVLFVVLLGALSLAGWRPVRVAEQALALLLVPASPSLARALPLEGAVARSAADDEELAGQAAAVWLAWQRELLRRPAPRRPGSELLVAPVLSADPSARELVVAVPRGAVAASTPVTWRGMLVGFLRPWRSSGERVEVEGRAKVALLGHPLARPVAAVWKAGPDADEVHFLLSSDEDGPVMDFASRRVEPSPGQLAWSRDVAGLGDELPGGLVLGRVASREREQPGGGLAQVLGRVLLEPLVEPAALDQVVLEVQAGHALPCRRLEARVLPACSQEALRIDRGLVDGVGEGDLVVQGPVLVGTVETAGPFSSVVRVGRTRGLVLVVREDGVLVPVPGAADDWPRDFQPEPGQLVLVGHRELGALHVGTVAGVSGGRLAVLPRAVDPRQPLEVVEP